MRSSRMKGVTSAFMKHTHYQAAITELRKWSRELERLEARSQAIQPSKRTGIDTRSEELERTKKLAVRMLNTLDEVNGDLARRLERKTCQTIAELRNGVQRMAESIRRIEPEK